MADERSIVDDAPDRAALERSATVPRQAIPALLLKRAVDLAIAIPACIVLAPLMLAVAVAIKVDSPGPVFFTQIRRGRHFEPFTIVKFRSLRSGAPDPHARYEMVEADPRITRVGAWLRKTSVDELPQIFNVLQGSMSLVGPRPLVEWESRQSLAGFPERFRVKPGVTGWCQVSVRNSVDFDARCRKDVEYVNQWSLWFDLRILALTPMSLLKGDGVYPESRP